MSAVPVVVWQCPPKTVLVGVDFGDASARALAIGGVVASIPVLVTRAAATPPRGVFERLALVHDGEDVDKAAHACAEHFARIADGSLIEGGPVTECEAGILQQASLVVMATRRRLPSWGTTDSVDNVLGACQRPVLFIPLR
jgi:hypothetical protein